MADKNPRVLDIASGWLAANGYDGLWNDSCSCLLADLGPCGDISADCEAGYKIECKPEECEDCQSDLCEGWVDAKKRGSLAWRISRTKP